MVKVNISKLIFYISFIFIVFAKFIQQTVYMEKIDFLNIATKIIIVIACIFLIFKYIIDKHSTESIIYSTLILIVASLISYISSGWYVIMVLAILLINMKNINIRKLIIIWIIEISILMLFIAISYKLGVIGETIVSWDRNTGIDRYTLGYNYTTFSSNYFFHLTIFYLYIKGNLIKYFELGILALLNIYLYNFTNTKSAVIYSILAIILVILIKKFNFSKGVSYINKFSMFGGGLIAGLITYLYKFDSAIISEANVILSGRLYYGYKGIEEYGITLFGQKITWINEVMLDSELQYNYIDSSYLNILFNYGIIVLLFIMLGYYILGKKNISKDIYYSILILIITLHSMFDPQLIEIMYNPSILLLGYVISKSRYMDSMREINNA
ncbi:hypothetical protein [uncultured Gemella sp.]|uniref:hypothetical protein n=1 Tax=uncultured Gemella sp. TaxID=254352 RepID=UPI0028E3B587|nr:hypothetical protein [uncultured Gemella sp.]